MACDVAVVMGSKSDLPRIESTLDILREFDVPFSVRVMSAHRTPKLVAEYAETADKAGVKVIIAAAGAAAHLAGVVAAHTRLPVIGLPLKGGALDGLDALLSTVQMPGGVPVATLGLGSGGAKNAALLAIRILALGQPQLARRLEQFHRDQAAAVAAADEEVQQNLCP
ncbi:MAG: 5-(carboxyamino)imidazole ribonucleotide mutase [Kiritimatiellaeota bacterium]|nr:5-(carboxyamino)imidazole ribonucleotide mutase [Kiritimatiellota bacterium]